MKEKIHDLKTALEVLRIQQTVSFDDCQKLMTDVHDKTGFTPPNFEISGNQWCVLVNLAIARFGSTPPQRKPCTWKKTDDIHMPDTWEADCGAVWTLMDGGPKDNDMHHCPKCGNPITEAAHDIKENT